MLDTVLGQLLDDRGTGERLDAVAEAAQVLGASCGLEPLAEVECLVGGRACLLQLATCQVALGQDHRSDGLVRRGVDRHLPCLPGRGRRWRSPVVATVRRLVDHVVG
jgi:hypothetical protein